MSRVLIISLLLSVALHGNSQICDISLTGKIIDSNDGTPLEIVNVYIKEIESGASTDINGDFTIGDLCAGSYHLILSHIGCESKEVFISITRDTVVTLLMDHSDHMMHEVILEASRAPVITQKTDLIKSQFISDNGNDNISNILETLPGVNTLKNGGGISKPIIHGLYGNRLTILNNGVTQSGQQWGNDHSPEIDPFAANQIKVIKGVSAIEYMGSNLGSIILVEPAPISLDPHLHGKATYLFNTNGRGHAFNTKVQKYSPALAWQLNATLKQSGDYHTPDYYLNNTGSKELSISGQLQKSYGTKLKSDLYFSTFNTELGILRGGHVGNITDLKEAFAREIPFFTESEFSYSIDAPRQSVGHHLLKLHTNYFINDDEWFDITIASQINDRQEYDVRRSGRSEIPALSLIQYTQFGEIKYHKENKSGTTINTGLQVNITDNTNRPETGILPLIPDYRSYESSAYFLATRRVKRSLFEGGIRYNNVNLDALTITNTVPREIKRYDHSFHNVNGSLGWSYDWDNGYNLSWNIGYGSRNPAINELYSFGLHQGVSGIEEGNRDLNTEHSIKSTIGLKGAIQEYFTFEVLGYYQAFEDFIYLQPSDELRLTIRGAFPVFVYQQDNATIRGVDLFGVWSITDHVQLSSKYSYLKGDNVTQDIPLIFMPANSIRNSLSYEYAKSIDLWRMNVNNLKFEVDHQYVFSQKHLLISQDFVVAPPAYQLFDLKVAANLQIKQIQLRCHVRSSNVLNTRYRGYLNRQRYFADDLGRSIVFGITTKF